MMATATAAPSREISWQASPQAFWLMPSWGRRALALSTTSRQAARSPGETVQSASARGGEASASNGRADAVGAQVRVNPVEGGLAWAVREPAWGLCGRSELRGSEAEWAPASPLWWDDDFRWMHYTVFLGELEVLLHVMGEA